MIIFKTPPIIFFFLFMLKVSCIDLTDIRVPISYESRLSRQNYRFNHPPSAEEDVPVSRSLEVNANLDKASLTLSSSSKGNVELNLNEQNEIDLTKKNSQPARFDDNLSEINFNARDERIKSRTKDKLIIETSNQPKITTSRRRGERQRNQLNNNNLLTKIDENINANMKEGEKSAGSVEEILNLNSSSETLIPVQVEYEKPAVTRSRQRNQRKRIDSEKVTGFRQQNVDEKAVNSVDARNKFQSIPNDDKVSITTFHPISTPTNSAATTIVPISKETNTLYNTKTEVTSSEQIPHKTNLSTNDAESLQDTPNSNKDNETFDGVVNGNIKPKSSSETFIPVKIVNEETPVKNSRARNQRKRVDSERIRGFKLEKVDEKSINSEMLQSAPSDNKIPIASDSPATIQTSTAKTTSLQPTTNTEKSEITIDKTNLETTITNVSKTIAEKKKRQRDPVVPIIESTNNIYSQSGSFKYSYESGDGTKAFSQGELKTFDDEKTGEAVVGGFSYKNKDGKDFSLTYTADEKGYRPVGDHLPTSPPIPVAIARALRYLATKTTPEPVTKPVSSELSTFETVTESEITTSVTKESTIGSIKSDSVSNFVGKINGPDTEVTKGSTIGSIKSDSVSNFVGKINGPDTEVTKESTIGSSKSDSVSNFVGKINGPDTEVTKESTIGSIKSDSVSNFVVKINGPDTEVKLNVPSKNILF